MPFILNISTHVNKPLIIISFACLHIDLRFPQVNTKAKEESLVLRRQCLCWCHDLLDDCKRALFFFSNLSLIWKGKEIRGFLLRSGHHTRELTRYWSCSHFLFQLYQDPPVARVCVCAYFHEPIRSFPARFTCFSCHWHTLIIKICTGRNFFSAVQRMVFWAAASSCVVPVPPPVSVSCQQ